MKQNWHSDINESSRCDSYKEFKTLLNVERYLSMDMQFYLRKAFARFRTSSHKLSIEIGRHIILAELIEFAFFVLTNLTLSQLKTSITHSSLVPNLMRSVRLISHLGTDKATADQSFSDSCKRRNQTLSGNYVYL